MPCRRARHVESSSNEEAIRPFDSQSHYGFTENNDIFK